MVQINRRLLPIKAHFFFFMAAMGPILPQLFVFGKDIGISPEIMGYITSVLPIMYVIAKPLFGFIADYFVLFRKYIFIILIIAMSLSYAGFYFVPDEGAHRIQTSDVWRVSFKTSNLNRCDTNHIGELPLCLAARLSTCHLTDRNVSLKAYLIDTQANSAKQMNMTGNLENTDENGFLHLCLQDELNTIPFNESMTSTLNANCTIEDGNQSKCLYRSTAFWLFIVLLFAGTIGFNVVNSISDAICFDMLGESEEDKYGAQRVWGTIGFGAAALISGIAVDQWTSGAVKSFTPALVIMLIFAGFDLLSVSKLKLPKLSTSESIVKDVWQLIKEPAIGIFLVFATIAGIIDSFIIYFMFWHLEEVAAETGFMDQIKLIEGCVVAAECLAGEVPFFLYSGQIIKKLGYVHCMSLCFFCYAVRLFLISWIPNPWYLVGVEFFLQGCTYALCYTCIVAYASAVAPPGTSATVQGLMAGMDDGLGFSIGSLIGGWALKRLGGRRSFFYFAIMAFCTCIAHIIIRPSSRKKQYLPKKEYQMPEEQLTMSSPNADKTFDTK